jgi:hypothetical protein
MLYQEDIALILYEEDPMHLKSPHSDEYSNEARMFLISLCNNEYDHILKILHKVFISQFNWGEDEEGNPVYCESVGDKSHFETSAKRICSLLNGDKP